MRATAKTLAAMALLVRRARPATRRMMLTIHRRYPRDSFLCLAMTGRTDLSTNLMEHRSLVHRQYSISDRGAVKSN
jgi:hypothetical protein